MMGTSWRVTLAAGVALTGLAAPVRADDAATLAARFGARESIQHISLSPDGNKVAMIVPGPGTTERLAVVDLAGDASIKPILNAVQDNETLSYCRWATDATLVCGAYFTQETELGRLGFSRLFSVRADGSDVQMLSKPGRSNALYAMQYGGGVLDWNAEGKPGRVLLTRQFVPEYSTGTHIASDKEGMGVEAVDVDTLKRSVIEQPHVEASEYIADGQGVVRMMGLEPTDGRGYSKGVINYLYRRRGSRDWQTLGQLKLEAQSEAGFNPYAIDSGKDVVYGFDDANGFKALYSVALDGSARKELVLGRNDVDVDGLIRIGRARRVVGASYATERRQAEFFDPELKRLRTALAKALPQLPIIEFVDASADEGKLLLMAGSDNHPGTFYLFDKATKELNEILPLRRGLDGVALGQMKPITFPAADGVQIPAYLTLPPGSDGRNLPAIVMPHGGPSARDEWGFDWLAQYFAVRGFAVLQPNYRGSAGYGSAWFQKNGFQSWKTAIGDVNAAGRWLEAQGIAARGKLAIVGWSYGGYAALQSPALDPDLFKAIVAVAPVTDLARLREESRDRSSFRLVSRFIGDGPHVREGSPAQNAAAIKAPVLLFHGDKDDNVGVGESRLMRDRLKDAGKAVEYIEFEGLDHQLDDPAARARLLSTTDAFLRRSLGL